MPIQPRSATRRVKPAWNSAWPRCGVKPSAASSVRKNSRTSRCNARADGGNSSAEKSTWSNITSLTAQRLDEPIEKFLAIVQRFDADPLVEPVDAAAVDIAEHARDAVGRNARVVEKTPIGRGDEHGWNNRRPRPHIGGDFIHRIHD